MRYNADGELVWAKPFEKLGDSEAGNNSIRFDALQLSAGGIYAVGRFDGLVDFEPGGNADSIGDARAFDLGKAFVARFDLSTGALNWLYDVSATSASGQTDYYVGHDLAVDGNGMAYFSFDSSSMNTSLASNNISVTFAGNEFTNSEGFFQQAWVAKINASGTIERIQRFGSYDALHNFGAGAGLEIAVDDSSPNEADWRLIVAAAAAGEVYLGDAAALSAETRIGTPAPNAAADQGFYDADLLLMSMTTDGELDWFRFDGGAGRQSAEDVFVNGNGDIYVDAGSFFW
ncbi:MAG: hypothetical protein KDA87_24995, partial [Planctomycetales bacterium]|nr:hypothetical protein [Planctomycetales bacterium]